MTTFNLYQALTSDLLINKTEKSISVIPKLTPKNYGKIKSVLTRLGGLWIPQKQHFKFTKCPETLIDRVRKLGSRQLNKFHFYPTPQIVFDYMVKFTPLTYFGASAESVRALEPSCGEGSLIRKLKAFGEQKNRDFIIDGYDIDPLNVVFCEEAGLSVQQADFLEVKPVKKYDLVIQNPPFNHDEFIKHIRHAQKFLTPDGIMLCVIPTGWLLETDKTENRKWLLEQIQLDDVSNIYEGNFFEVGTFKDVGISTAVISLLSVEAAERKVNNDTFKQESIDSYEFFNQTSAKFLTEAQKLKLSEPDYSTARNGIEEIVNNQLKNNDDGSIHIVKRFESEYVISVLAELFPEYRQYYRDNFSPQLEMFNTPELEEAA